MKRGSTVDTTADRMAAAYFAAIELLCEETPNGWYAERGTARAAVTHAGVAALNCAYDTAPEPDLASLAELAVEVGRLAEPWSIMVRGRAGDEVAALAARHGLVERSDLPLLACAADEAVFRSDAAHLKSVRPVGAAESDRYTEVLTEGFEAPEGVFDSLMSGSMLDAAPITGYLADESGQPVGTGLGVLTAGVIGVFNIAVIPSARGRGLGRTITEAVLLDGFQAGADAAYLHASVLGRPLYESMGFRLVENWTAFEAGEPS